MKIIQMLADASRNFVQKGSLKNKKLPVLRPIKGHSRATPQKIKEAAFQILRNHIDEPANCIFIDLFSGSGQMGIEALSQNFGYVLFCEWDMERKTKIFEWLQKHYPQKNYRIIKRDAFSLFSRIQKELPEHFFLKGDGKIVFYADPPYSFDRGGKSAFEVLLNEFTEKFSMENAQAALLILQGPTHPKKMYSDTGAKTLDLIKQIGDHFYAYANNFLAVKLKSFL